MIRSLVLFIKKLFTRKKKHPFAINVIANSLPEAFGYPEEQYKHIVNDLRKELELEDHRLIALERYLQTELFKQYKIDVNNPNHAAVLGYAFATAIIIERDEQKQSNINNLLQTFYGDNSQQSFSNNN